MPAWIVFLAVVSGALGATTAFCLYRAFVVLRRELLVPVVLLGWVFSVLVLCAAILGGLLYFCAGSDPEMYFAPALGVLALQLVAALCGYATIALWQKRVFDISWAKAFGAVMTEVGAALIIAGIAQDAVYPLAEKLRGGNNAIPRILESFAQARKLIEYFDGALFLALLVLQIVGPAWRLRQNTRTQHDGGSKRDETVKPSGE